MFSRYFSYFLYIYFCLVESSIGIAKKYCNFTQTMIDIYLSFVELNTMKTSIRFVLIIIILTNKYYIFS